MSDEAKARMDPWCLVETPGGDTVLFGFARDHPATGGQGWVRSTPVYDMDDDESGAVTASGRRYELGERVEPDSLPAEARTALALLAGPVAGACVPDDPITAVAWLTACKMARHLGVEPPAMEKAAVSAFAREHGELYRFLRSGQKPS